MGERQCEVVKDFDSFVQRSYNECALPRLIQFRDLKNTRELVAQAANPTVISVWAVWTVNDRFAIFGSYNFGLTPASPHTIALTGFVVAH
jgi:hypothetical protein